MHARRVSCRRLAEIGRRSVPPMSEPRRPASVSKPWRERPRHRARGVARRPARRGSFTPRLACWVSEEIVTEKAARLRRRAIPIDGAITGRYPASISPVSHDTSSARYIACGAHLGSALSKPDPTLTLQLLRPNLGDRVLPCAQVPAAVTARLRSSVRRARFLHCDDRRLSRRWYRSQYRPSRR
jgi:hypothetical protein